MFLKQKRVLDMGNKMVNSVYNLLFADDMDAPHEAIDEVAGDYPNFNLIHACTGEEVLERIKQGRIHILITDNNFENTGGDITGLETVRRVRQYEQEESLEEPIYTAVYSDGVSKEEVQEAGANGYISKIGSSEDSDINNKKGLKKALDEALGMIQSRE